MSSPKLLRKISCKGRPLRVLVLGQPAVGKTALTVRFITRRFIGDYDPTLERRYRCQREIDGETIAFDVFDTAGQLGEEDEQLEDKLRWADAYILVYSTTDRCSFDECTRLKFLISHVVGKRSNRRLNSSLGEPKGDPGGTSGEAIVALVANKNDLEAERMVPMTEGRERSRHLACTSFYDISVRESYEQARQVFEDLYKTIKRRSSHGSSSSSSRKQYLKHQNAVTDSPPSPRGRESRTLADSPSPPSPRSRESRVPVLGLSKDEPGGGGVFQNSLPIPDTRLSPEWNGSGGSNRERRSSTRRKKSVSKRIISKVIPSFSSSSKETDSFRSDSDLTTDSS